MREVSGWDWGRSARLSLTPVVVVRAHRRPPVLGAGGPDRLVFWLCAPTASLATPCCSEAGRAVPALPVRLGTPSPRARDLVSVVPRVLAQFSSWGIPEPAQPFPRLSGETWVLDLALPLTTYLPAS